jgi:prepilin-type processing-associated H-X9-DG protein
LAANLTLDLIRTDTVISIAPDTTMTPDELRRILTASGAGLDMTPIRMGGSGDDATLSAILFPVFAQARVAAQRTQALSNAKQIALAALMYSNDYDDQFPYVQSTDQFRHLTYPYSKNDSVWKTTNPNGGGFRFAMNLAGVAETSIDNPAEAPLIYEANAWPDGQRVVAFADGHVKRISNAEWSTIESRLTKKYPRKAKYPIKGG